MHAHGWFSPWFSLEFATDCCFTSQWHMAKWYLPSLLYGLYAVNHRWTFLRQRRPTARARSAKSTPCIRSHSTRRERIALLFRENGVMIASNQVMEGRQSLFSTRRYDFYFCPLSPCMNVTLCRKRNWVISQD